MEFPTACIPDGWEALPLEACPTADTTPSAPSNHATANDASDVGNGGDDACETLEAAPCSTAAPCVPLMSVAGEFFGCIEDPGCGDDHACASDGERHVEFTTDCIPSGWERLAFEDCRG